MQTPVPIKDTGVLFAVRQTVRVVVRLEEKSDPQAAACSGAYLAVRGWLDLRTTISGVKLAAARRRGLTLALGGRSDEGCGGKGRARERYKSGNKSGNRTPSERNK